MPERGVHTSKAYLDGKFAEISDSGGAATRLRISSRLEDLHVYQSGLDAKLSKLNEKLDRIWTNMPRSTKRSRAGRDRKRAEVSRPEPRHETPAPVADATFQQQVLEGLQAMQANLSAIGRRVQQLEATRNVNRTDFDNEIALLRDNNSMPLPTI